MEDFRETACKRNGFIETGLVISWEQSLCWQIEHNIFLYYLLYMICGTLHVKEMVSLNMASFLVWNNLCAGKLIIRSFLYYLLGMIGGTLNAKEMVSLNMASFLVWNNLCAGKLSIRSFFIIYYV